MQKLSKLVNIIPVLVDQQQVPGDLREIKYLAHHILEQNNVDWFDM